MPIRKGVSPGVELETIPCCAEYVMSRLQRRHARPAGNQSSRPLKQRAFDVDHFSGFHTGGCLEQGGEDRLIGDYLVAWNAGDHDSHVEFLKIMLPSLRSMVTKTSNEPWA